MWVPTLLSQDPSGGVPTGCVFSALMMAITMGGVLFPPLHSFITSLSSKAVASEVSASVIYLIAGVSMAVPAACLSGVLDGDDCFTRIIISFCVMELCVGLFMPVAGTLRSKYVPDALQGAILNIFRLPLNVIVVGGTYATDVLPTSTVFTLVSGFLFSAALLQASLIVGAGKTSVSQKKQD
jgi:hypothetical protein